METINEERHTTDKPQELFNITITRGADNTEVLNEDVTSIAMMCTTRPEEQITAILKGDSETSGSKFIAKKLLEDKNMDYLPQIMNVVCGEMVDSVLLATAAKLDKEIFLERMPEHYKELSEMLEDVIND